MLVNLADEALTFIGQIDLGILLGIGLKFLLLGQATEEKKSLIVEDTMLRVAPFANTGLGESDDAIIKTVLLGVAICLVCASFAICGAARSKNGCGWCSVNLENLRILILNFVNWKFQLFPTLAILLLILVCGSTIVYLVLDNDYAMKIMNKLVDASTVHDYVIDYVQEMVNQLID